MCIHHLSTRLWACETGTRQVSGRLHPHVCGTPLTMSDASDMLTSLLAAWAQSRATNVDTEPETLTPMVEAARVGTCSAVRSLHVSNPSLLNAPASVSTTGTAPYMDLVAAFCGAYELAAGTGARGSVGCVVCEDGRDTAAGCVPVRSP